MSAPANNASAPEMKITDAKLRSILAASKLTAVQRATLSCMCDAVNRRTLEIRIGMERLGALLGVQRRATVKRVRSLERAGVIVPVRTGGGRAENGRGYVNAWTLDLDRLRNRDARGDAPRGAREAPVIPVVQMTQGCTSDDTRVNESAQDSMYSSNPKEKPENAAPPAAKVVGAASNLEACRPWINPESAPEERANTARQKLRMDLERLKQRDAAAAMQGAGVPENSLIARKLGVAIYERVKTPPKPRRQVPWYEWMASTGACGASLPGVPVVPGVPGEREAPCRS